MCLVVLLFFGTATAQLNFLAPRDGGASTSVQETAATGHKIYELFASGGTGSYVFSFVSQSPPTPSFTLKNEQDSGSLLVPDGLDAETQQTFVFIFSVNDSTTTTQSSTLTVNVNDENDNVPYFLGTPYVTTIQETATNGDTVMVITGADDDINYYITYRITDGNLNDTYSLARNNADGTATVMLAASNNLDASMTPRYTLEIEVYDGTLRNTTTLVIDVVGLTTTRSATTLTTTTTPASTTTTPAATTTTPAATTTTPASTTTTPAAMTTTPAATTTTPASTTTTPAATTTTPASTTTTPVVTTTTPVVTTMSPAVRTTIPVSTTTTPVVTTTTPAVTTTTLAVTTTTMSIATAGPVQGHSNESLTIIAGTVVGGIGILGVLILVTLICVKKSPLRPKRLPRRFSGKNGHRPVNGYGQHSNFSHSKSAPLDAYVKIGHEKRSSEEVIRNPAYTNILYDTTMSSRLPEQRSDGYHCLYVEDQIFMVQRPNESAYRPIFDRPFARPSDKIYEKHDRSSHVTSARNESIGKDFAKYDFYDGNSTRSVDLFYPRK